MLLEKKLQLAWQKIQEAKNILLIGHISPDPDALASIGVMLEVCQLFNLRAQAYAQGKSVGVYDFIPHESQVKNIKPINLHDFDTILVLDCGSLARTGLVLELGSLIQAKRQNQLNRPFIIEFDHHEPHDKYADLEIKLPQKAATVEIIHDFIKANNLPINKTIASCILIGLMSDTGHFLHSNSSFKVLTISSQMLLKGASLNKLSAQIKGVGGLVALKIWGKALDNLKFNPETGLASSALTANDLGNFSNEKEALLASDVFGEIASFMSYLPGVKVALFLREEEGKVKGSLRSNGSDVDVAKIAGLFGGGGHKRAAGFAVLGKLVATNNGWKVVN